MIFVKIIVDLKTILEYKMPRQTKAKTVSETTSQAVSVPAVVEVVAAPVEVAPAKSARKRAVKVEVSAPVEVAAPAPVVVEEVVASEEAADPAQRKQRAVHTRETVLRDFSELTSYLESEITASRSATGKAGNTKALRRVLSSVKDLQRAVSHAIKQKPASARKNNNSGFLKPVQISPEISKFTGFDASQLHSRVDVNNYICAYIKKHNLQNPADRRQIVPDEKLASVIGYTHGTDKPLTYPGLQKYMTRHYPSA